MRNVTAVKCKILIYTFIFFFVHLLHQRIFVFAHCHHHHHRQPVTGIWLQILMQKCGNASGMQKSVYPHMHKTYSRASTFFFPICCFIFNVKKQHGVIASLNPSSPLGCHDALDGRHRFFVSFFFAFPLVASIWFLCVCVSFLFT